MVLNVIASVVAALFYAVPTVLALIIAVLVIKALLKYLRTADARRERTQIRRSLAETLKEHRTRCKMTQEFVAEAVGVSRQAVSKWENGSSDPSTANLLQLAKLYGVAPEELLNAAAGGTEPEDGQS